MNWRNIVEELFNNIDDLLTLCPSCVPDDPCISEFSLSLPMDIQVLSECCACLLENVLESKQNLYRIYRYNEAGESVAIYKLGDVIVEVSSSTATIVPIDRIEIYIEMLQETGAQDLEILKKWLAELNKSSA